MQSEKKITRANAPAIIKQFAREYRKALGKAPGEIIIVGGGSIMLNYKFRDATQDFDVILHTASGVKDVINKFADENNLPRDWMNTDFTRTDSYSDKLTMISQHYLWLNNHTLEIRTVSGKYLIAMKLVAHRDYRNDISDAIGILIEERQTGSAYTYDEIEDAFQELYNRLPDQTVSDRFQKLCSLSTDELTALYQSQKDIESEIDNQVITYIHENAPINSKNIGEVTAKLRERLGGV